MCTWPKTIDMKRNSPAEIRRHCILNTLPPPLPKNMELQPQALTYTVYISSAIISQFSPPFRSRLVISGWYFEMVCKLTGFVGKKGKGNGRISQSALLPVTLHPILFTPIFLHRLLYMTYFMFQCISSHKIKQSG